MIERDEAISLLSGRKAFIEEWNRLRELGEEVPELEAVVRTPANRDFELGEFEQEFGSLLLAAETARGK